MPYRGKQEPLILEGLGIACLSGANGAGKSSLLDAITWALWGRSRAGASADQLVAAGMADMSVQLEFRSHDIDYRVERRHRRRQRGGSTTLDFQIRDGDRWRPLNETTVRETNRKVVDTIRLDYETFINSAFLLAGAGRPVRLAAPGGTQTDPGRDPESVYLSELRRQGAGDGRKRPQPAPDRQGAHRLYRYRVGDRGGPRRGGGATCRRTVRTARAAGNRFI